MAGHRRGSLFNFRLYARTDDALMNAVVALSRPISHIVVAAVVEYLSTGRYGASAYASPDVGEKSGRNRSFDADPQLVERIRRRAEEERVPRGAVVEAAVRTLLWRVQVDEEAAPELASLDRRHRLRRNGSVLDGRERTAGVREVGFARAEYERVVRAGDAVGLEPARLLAEACAVPVGKRRAEREPLWAAGPAKISIPLQSRPLALSVDHLRARSRMAVVEIERDLNARSTPQNPRWVRYVQRVLAGVVRGPWRPIRVRGRHFVNGG